MLIKQIISSTFSQYDRNKTGYLEKEELLDFVSEILLNEDHFMKLKEIN